MPQNHNDRNMLPISLPKKLVKKWKLLNLENLFIKLTAYICYIVSQIINFVFFFHTFYDFFFLFQASHIHTCPIMLRQKIIYSQPWMLFQEHISRENLFCNWLFMGFTYAYMLNFCVRHQILMRCLGFAIFYYIYFARDVD